MDRRAFIAGMTSALVAAPRQLMAQHPRNPARIGVLAAPFSDDPKLRPLWEAFTGGLRDLGWIENHNVVFDRRYAGEGVERYSQPVAELVALRPDIIVSGLGEPAIVVLKKATATIPIVMLVSADPVGTGVAANLARPGGNVTGMSLLAPELGGKRLAILREAVATVARVAVIWNRAYPGKAAELRDSQDSAAALKVAVKSVEVRGPNDLQRAFSTIERYRPDALIVFADPLTVSSRQQIVDFATRHRLPMISELRQFAEAGALMSYGASLADLFRRAAVHVDKILKGAKAGDLPIEQPTKFELVMNLRTAKSLGLTIPASLLQRADQVIE
jgi:putative ABC transport system substrate-binding protein